MSPHPFPLASRGFKPFTHFCQAVSDIPGCNQGGCQRLISTRPNLADTPHRVDLFKKLASGTGMKSELRYLLHGSAENYDDNEAIYYIPADSDDNTFWEKLGKQVLDKRDESWRILNLDLVQLLSQTAYGQLGIETLTASSVIKEIEQSYEKQGKGCLNTTTWSNDDYDQLLIYLFNNNKSLLWKGLALHKDSQGKRVSINDQTFLVLDEVSHFNCPKGLAELVTLIPSSPNTQVQISQKAWIAKWSDHQALLILLSQAEPHQNFTSVLKVLEQSLETLWKNLLPDDAVSLKKQLRNTQWLLTKEGEGVSPNQIIQVPESLKNHEQVIISVMEGRSISQLDDSIQTYPRTHQWLRGQFKAPKELEILPNILKVMS